MKIRKKNKLFLPLLLLGSGTVLLLAVFLTSKPKESLSSHLAKKGIEKVAKVSGQVKKTIPLKKSVMGTKQKANQKKNSSLVKKTDPMGIFKTFKITPAEEKDFFSKRKNDPENITLGMSGLIINRSAFKVKAMKDLPRKLHVPLPPENNLTEFTLRRVDFKNKDSFVWVGREKGSEFGNTHISYYHGAVSGSVNNLKGNYVIDFLSPGKEVIRKINMGLIPMDESVLENLHKDEEITTGEPLAAAIPEGARSTISNEEVDKSGDTSTPQNVVIDYLIGYESSYDYYVGGETQARANINGMVSLTNTIFENSRTGVRINLMEVMRFQFIRPTSYLPNPGPSGSWAVMEAAEKRRMGRYDGNDSYQRIMHRRNELKADLVTLITDNHRAEVTWCALSNFLWLDETPKSYRPKGYNTMGRGVCLHGHVLAHEIGHNLGASHHYTGPKPSGALAVYKALPYNYGFRYWDGLHGYVDEDKPFFRTIMAYICKNNVCPQISFFSNPLMTLNGIPLGNEEYSNISRAIRERSWLVRDIYTSINVPTIIVQPQSVHIPEYNEAHTLTVSVTTPEGSPILTYRWYRDGELLSGENTSSLVVYPTTLTNGLQKYRTEILNQSGWAQSEEIEVTCDRNKIAFSKKLPKNERILWAADTILLDPGIHSPDGASLSHQWYQDGTALAGKTGSTLLVDGSFNTTTETSIFKVKVMTTVAGKNYEVFSKETKIHFFRNKYDADQICDYSVSSL